MVKGLKYKNITITGKICTGTTTLSGSLLKKLQPLGWQYFNAGQFFRDYCKKHNIPLVESQFKSEELVKKVDYGIQEKLQKESKNIFEAWLAGFMARDILGVLKVLLVCDDVLRIDRLVNRDSLTVEEAKEHIKEREKKNFEKWSKLYQATDFWNPKHYDLVIDTYSNSKEETLNEVLNKLGYDDS